MAVVTADNTMRVEALDPTTGTMSQSGTFMGGNASLAFDNSDPGFVWRQAFNSSFTEMAASGPQEADGSSNAGVVTYQGGYRQLTASTSGSYGGQLKKYAIGFNPGTGDLWYMTDQGKYGYVSHTTGKDTVLKSNAPQNGVIGGANDRTYFVPKMQGTYVPIDILAHTDDVYLPGGPEVDRDPVNDAYKIGNYNHITDMTPDIKTTGVPWNGLPWMAIPVDSHRFLATDNQTNELYVGAISGNTVHLHPLLPKNSNVALGDMVASPDKTEVAFIGTNEGGQNHLYVASLSAYKSPPRELPQFDSNLGSAYGMLDWLP
jgi:hypothetical protein